jgi:hypothetical protein
MIMRKRTVCRNIKMLRYPDRAPTDEELHDAALQFVRKISGYRVPSKANAETFDRAVADIAAVARSMFSSLVVGGASRLA